MSKSGQIELLWSNCSTGPCPSIYRDEEGRIVVQGFKISSEVRSQINAPDHEDAVIVTPELIEALKKVL